MITNILKEKRAPSKETFSPERLQEICAVKREVGIEAAHAGGNPTSPWPAGGLMVQKASCPPLPCPVSKTAGPTGEKNPSWFALFSCFFSGAMQEALGASVPLPCGVQIQEKGYFALWNFSSFPYSEDLIRFFSYPYSFINLCALAHPAYLTALF